MLAVTAPTAISFLYNLTTVSKEDSCCYTLFSPCFILHSKGVFLLQLARGSSLGSHLLVQIQSAVIGPAHLMAAFGIGLALHMVGLD